MSGSASNVPAITYELFQDSPAINVASDETKRLINKVFAPVARPFRTPQRRCADGPMTLAHIRLRMNRRRSTFGPHFPLSCHTLPMAPSDPPLTEHPDARANGLPEVAPDAIEEALGEEIDNIVPTRGYQMTP